ncbi:MAG: anthranilate synthase component I family protein [Clostridiales bacterium]|nr:anthranilate synthase component I family protein [Clostridiales bacterium]
MECSLSDLKTYAKEYPLVPVWRTLKTDMQSPVDLLRQLRRYSHRLFVLEQTGNDEKGTSVWDRYSYIGWAPSLEISCLDHTVTLSFAQSSFSFEADNPVETLRALINQNRAPRLPGLPSFFGGFAGYFSYEYIHLTEPTCHFCTENTDGTPDFDLMLFDKLYVLDREEGQLYLICTISTEQLEKSLPEADALLDEMESMISHASQQAQDSREPLRLLDEFSPIYTKKFYAHMVEKAKDYIQKGEVAQIVLTNGMRVRAEGSLVDTFALLRETDPTRYLCYFSTDDVEAAIASPEPIIRLRDGVVMTERLAGSYARGRTPEEDAAQAKALMDDEKAADEHNMLVDDSRNEFGFVSKFGTVQVTNYRNIVRCSRVMHLGSTVTGELKEDMGALDIINAIMPSGAVSGAPKIRSCEVINEIEQERRGVYGSAVGYIGFDGDADFFVFIHSAFLKGGQLTVRAGGGIVIDSQTEEEYQEAMVKTEAMVNTIRLAAKEAEK